MIDSTTATEPEATHWLVSAKQTEQRSVYHLPWPKFPVHLVGVQSGYEYRKAQRLPMQKYVAYVLCRYPLTQTRPTFAWLMLKTIAQTVLGRALTLDEKTLMASVGRRVFAEIKADRARHAPLECPACHGSGHVTVRAYPEGEAIPSAFQDVALCGCCDGTGQVEP